VITKKMLCEHDACGEQVRLFIKTFGREVKITLAVCRNAVKVGLNLQWASENLLSAPALAEYERVKAQAWAEYERVTVPALAEYERVKAQAFNAAWKIQRKIAQSALDECGKN
jgi:hypothetical protein